MNILHYSLGLPPYRTGGLTKYSIDLMKEQAENGDKVYLLFPGKFNLINRTSSIGYYKKYLDIDVYEIINPLPVPLLNGISHPKEFMRECDKSIFQKFLKKNSIEIVHIHTLMGLYKEFLEACNELNIKVFYTSHDYFGLCTKVNFIDNYGQLCEKRNISKCVKCNMSANSIKKIKVLQSPLYRFFKNIGGVEKLKKLQNKVNYNKARSDEDLRQYEKVSDNQIKELQELYDYYESMFRKIDLFLFNSSVAKSVYEKYIDCEGEVVPITHSDIKDKRKTKNFDNHKLKLTYLGPEKKYKGFDMLMDTMKAINNEYKDMFELNMYGDIKNNNFDTNIKAHGRYSYDDLEIIFDNTDLLIVPSIWYETFGFIVLEAFSYGVPVLVTDRVGSKDIIQDVNLKKGLILNINKSILRNSINEIIGNRKILEEINNNILKSEFPYSIDEHARIINEKYRKLTEN